MWRTRELWLLQLYVNCVKIPISCELTVDIRTARFPCQMRIDNVEAKIGKQVHSSAFLPLHKDSECLPGAYAMPYHIERVDPPSGIVETTVPDVIDCEVAPSTPQKINTIVKMRVLPRLSSIHPLCLDELGMSWPKVSFLVIFNSMSEVPK
jgi:hypothetical protein